MAASRGNAPTNSLRSSSALSDMSVGHGERRRRLLYGRRKGPKLSRHQVSLFQTLLPQFELKPERDRDARSYFDRPVEEVWLEIGFGGGEHLFWQAEHHPIVGLIGAEPYEAGMAKLLSKFSISPNGRGDEGQGEGVAQRSPTLQTSGARQAATSPLPGPLPRFVGAREQNLRLYRGDARDIIETLPDASLARVFLLFPDPWPKKRHHKRRFIQMDSLDALARVMKPGAELRFASDDAGYIEWVLERMLAHPAFEWTAIRSFDWKTRPPDWPPTRYEQKALHGVPAFLLFQRRGLQTPVVQRT